MCGIVGTAGRSAAVSEQLLTTMRDTMAHRGPDDAGNWLDPAGRVQLAHRRLSIIDLSSGGHQPMCDDSGDLALVFNGEIYNFQSLREQLAGAWQFRSESDTEVILAACGPVKFGNWTDDPDNWGRAFQSSKPDDVEVVHSYYYRSPHFTYEFSYYFHIRANRALRASRRA